MKKIQLWSVDRTEDKISATPVKSVDNTETEQNLEDLLVASPDLLMNNLTLIGRQVPTDGGPLDLIGIDADGRLVVFELKRGTLTRDAVAQVLDYASDLAALDEDRFARLIEEHSGQRGIEPREDFIDWYRQEYPNEEGILDSPPRMVLVGLGVDDRARRVVNFLAASRVDIQLLTFHAFRDDGRLFLARQIESLAPGKNKTTTATKEGNRKILHETAERMNVKQLLERVASFIDERISGYRYPGKTAYSFSLQERTREGRPTLRSYVTLYVNVKERGSLTLVLPPRATQDCSSELDDFCAALPNAIRDKNQYTGLEISFGEDEWTSLAAHFDKLLAAVVSGWRQRSSRNDGANEDT